MEKVFKNITLFFWLSNEQSRMIVFMDTLNLSGGVATTSGFFFISFYFILPRLIIFLRLEKALSLYYPSLQTLPYLFVVKYSIPGRDLHSGKLIRRNE